jgi:hypothetical protein
MNWLLIALGLTVLVNVVAGLWFLVAAFRVGILWGICVLLIPGAALVFLVMHWAEAKTPFLISLLTGIGMLALLLSSKETLQTAAKDLLAQVQVHEPIEAEAVEKGQSKSDAPPAATEVESVSDAAKSADLLALKRVELDRLAQEMNRRYADLQARQATLDARDPAAVKAFNAEAKKYHEVRQQVAARKAELDGAAGKPPSPPLAPPPGR